MPLDDRYLQYAHRSYGMDQDRYAWRLPEQREPLRLAPGKTVAALIVVPIEHHMLDPDAKPFKHPGAMVTPYPDLRHFTSRDYGNRVGVFRLLRLLKEHGLKATFPINADALTRLRPLVDAIAEDGHELAAYGLATDKIHWSGLERSLESTWVAECRRRLDAVGLHPTTWMSPARQQSFSTLDLIAEHRFERCLDWEQDTVPVAMKTSSTPVLALPVSNELDDRTLLIDRRQSEDDWVGQIRAAIDYTKSESERRGAQVVGFTLTPYVSGQPFRTEAVDRLLGAIAGDAAVSTLTAEALARASMTR